MNYNDQQQNHHLLIWIQKEFALNNQEQIIIYNQPQSLVPAISFLLTKIDQKFDRIIKLSFSHQVYLNAIQNYLLQEHSLQIVPENRDTLIQRRSLLDLAKLVLFLIMKSPFKQQSITIILELSEESQMFLMSSLEQTQDSMLTTIPIKEINQKIEELEDQNEALRQKVTEIDQRNQEAYRLRQQNITENQKLNEQNRSNLTQKLTTMQKLGLTEMSSYICTLKALQNKRIEYFYTQKQLQGESIKTKEQNDEMSEKIEEDRTIISHLHSQIQQYKHALADINSNQPIKSTSCSIFDDISPSRPSFSKSTRQNKQNLPNEFLSIPIIPNVKLISSVNHNSSITSFKNMLEEDSSFSHSIKDHSDQLQQKLHQMQMKIYGLNQQISEVKEKKVKLRKDNQKKAKIVQLALRQFEAFKVDYQYTISG